MPYDLTHAQFVVLASAHWLSLQLQDVTQIALSKHSKIDTMTVSAVLRKLNTKKLITRIEHPTDTRAKTVLLTKKGQELVKKAIVIVENFDKEFFSKLKSGLPTFNKSLVKLLNHE
ncbi:DNA-binding transcriptional regulator, MarR family [Arachidicoccus rhizosphaerae]|uniref:DNA-binding transcriptional regulator, MarR family n=1 Tax=Arachidicoccus rhizosphaerae TaxID=551991 RepID=A0A1H3WRF3_9BACT|nr:MarR family transcriptional regulator [Arachidicoccus rhizosphaerae]SDZ88934.1 DNA-binding transcriptional regulator, MarR family [Arachidicoccus rhizosphaerae]